MAELDDEVQGNVGDSPASGWESDIAFIRRVLSALLRLVAACVFMGADWCFNRIMVALLAHAPTIFVTFLETVGLVAFAGLDVYLLWDMWCVFLPKLKGTRS